MLFYFKDIYIFIQQEWIKMIKSDSKYIYNVTKDYINAVLLNFLFIKASWKNDGFHKNICIFNTDK